MTVFFEAPHRIRRTLDDVSSQCVNRPIFVAREITKKNETLVVRAIQASQEWEDVPELGEFTVIVGLQNGSRTSEAVDPQEMVEMFWRLTNAAALDDELSLELVAHTFETTTADVRKVLKRHRILVMNQNSDTA